MKDLVEFAIAKAAGCEFEFKDFNHAWIPLNYPSWNAVKFDEALEDGLIRIKPISDKMPDTIFAVNTKQFMGVTIVESRLTPRADMVSYTRTALVDDMLTKLNEFWAANGDTDLLPALHAAIRAIQKDN